MTNQEKCIKQNAPNVEKNVKCLSNQPKVEMSFAKIVLGRNLDNQIFNNHIKI